MMPSFAIMLAVASVSQGASHHIERGMQAFRDGAIDKSLQAFDRAIESDSRVEPFLWQRGISQYCMGQYEEGRKQFESHQTVNPNDVENAAWHFLCVAKLKGADAARKQRLVIAADLDKRVPMQEIYQMISGEGSEQKVLAAAKEDGSPQAMMYAHLYLGLLSEVEGAKASSRRHLAIAAEQSLENSYMQEVARVRLRQRDKRTLPEEAKSKYQKKE